MPKVLPYSPPRETPFPSEKALQAASIKRVREVWQGEVLNVHGGSVAQTKGTPDLLICVFGRFVAVELKQPGEEPTPLQAKKLRDWAAAGAIVGVARTLVDLDALLEQARPGARMAVCTDPECRIPRRPGFPPHGPHDFRAAG